MRSQGASNTGQHSGNNENHKKSVFERLGHQVELNSNAMKRRPSHGNSYSEFMPTHINYPTSSHGPPPPVFDSDFGRNRSQQYLVRGDMPHQPGVEMDWRYHVGDRSRQAFIDRHGPPQPPQIGGPGPANSAFQYGMEMSGPRHGEPFFGPPNPFNHSNQTMQPGPPMGPGNLNIHHQQQQRLSPPFDGRHSNQRMHFKDRPMRYPSGPIDMGPMHMPNEDMSPPRMFMGSGPLPVHSRDPIANVTYEHQQRPPIQMIRCDIDMISGPQHDPNRMMGPIMLDPSQGPSNTMNFGIGGEHSRYTKWRERRDFITNLDRETAQSSFRTDSLKSTLQHPTSNRTESSITPVTKSSSNLDCKFSKSNDSIKDAARTKRPRKKRASIKKQTLNPQDISDGEIVDDESSSDDESVSPTTKQSEIQENPNTRLDRQKLVRSRRHIESTRSNHNQYYEKRSRHDRDQESMNYETISDEDLDDFMDDREKVLAEGGGFPDEKNNSEKELLNALGLDWANLVEMAKQTRSFGKDNTTTTASALTRFRLSEYLPTLGISRDLVNPEIFSLVDKVCRA